VPDLVDLEQLTDRLSMEPGIIHTMRKRRLLPEPHLHVGSQELWWWPNVSLRSRQRGRSIGQPHRQDVMPDVDLVDVSEIAKRLGVPVRYLRFWASSGKLPEPDYHWSRTRAWLWETIDTWADGRGRRLVAGANKARDLVAEGVPTARLGKLIEEVAAEERHVLGTSRLSTEPDLSDAEFLARLDKIRARLEEIAIGLEDAKGTTPRDTA